MNVYLQRRTKLMEELQGNNIVYIFSNELIKKSADETYPFQVDKNFYYLTGLQEDNMILEISKFNDEIISKIYTLPHDEVMSKWIGSRMTFELVKEISGVDFVYDKALFETHFGQVYNNNRCETYRIGLDLWQYDTVKHLSPASKFAKFILDTYYVVPFDIYNNLTRQRLIKDELEISHIKKAIDITYEGIKNIMDNAKSNVNEMELEGSFMFGLMKNGCKKTAFSTILAGGKNATVLHYVENDQIIKDNEMALCDLGATYNNYCGDITRTIPVNGKYTQRQKEIYNCVLKGQQLVIDNATKGKTLRQLNDILVEYYQEELPKINLNKPVSTYYFHGVSHMLGLDTHDVDLKRGTTVLEKGMVITVEPGLYVEDESIGIRIEDDILITDEKPIVLSKDIIKTIEDIENYMNK